LHCPAWGNAALKKYGLLEDDGAREDRRAKLSRLADDILSNPDETKQKEAIQEAALRPAIHREMWDKYHLDLPSNNTLLWELTRSRGFTERGANEFLRVYRATLAFAQLEDADRPPRPSATRDVPEIEDDDPYENTDDSQPERPSDWQRHPSGEKAKSYPIPLIDNGVVVVEGEFPITIRDWDQFIAVLQAMKPGLVTPEED
jgi:hypothetical protein